ncbi:hypothetical protein [Sphingobium sp. CFD-1]|uniref:hypothetical protein n=1 Tax=Sphingobium sp. CFD-1 TaxID=2878545 RepID=UPI00214C6736|nr:hypothetical protein [Sphingobium sp. CFD-1]
MADRKIVSSAGISASIPISIALVEAIAGHDRATALAREIGVADWGSRHDSDAFQLQGNEKPRSMADKMEGGDSIGVPVTAGIDEVALALTAEAYTHTGRGQAVAIASNLEPVRTRHGLLIIPDRIANAAPPLAHTLPAIPDGPSAQALDKALAAIDAEYGRAAAYSAARVMEYPAFAK